MKEVSPVERLEKLLYHKPNLVLYMKRFPLLLLLLGLLSLSFFSCDEDSSFPLPQEGELPKSPGCFIVFPPNGPGDNGYLDKMLNAATIYTMAHPGMVYMIMPKDSLEMSNILDKIDLLTIDDTVNDTALCVFVGTEYKTMLYNAEAPKGKLKVLLIEDDGEGAPQWLHTCEINRYGAGYLAGAMVAHQPAIIIAAMPGEPIVDKSIEGFKKGFESVKGREVDSVYYLSNSYDGFKMQEKARKLTDSIITHDPFMYRTIYPVAGAANLGVYNAIRDTRGCQVIGMDKDYSYMTYNMPFSIVVNVDSLLLDYFNIWDSSRTLPQKRIEGLDSKYISFEYNRDWNKYNLLFNWEQENPSQGGDIESTILTVEFWKQRYAMFVDRAIKEEKAYEKY